MMFIVSIAMKEPLLQQVDKLRGDVSRSKFVSRLLEGIIYSRENRVSKNKGEIVI